MLLVSDGTYAGTTYFDPIPNSTSGWNFLRVFPNTLIHYEPQPLPLVIDGYAFFAGGDSNGYNQLYKTDGTANGTVKVTDFSNGTEIAGSGYWHSGIRSYGNVVGNTLYFQVDDVATGVELWKTDGTTSGTSMVKDINVGSGDGIGVSGTGIPSLSIGDTLFFAANDGTHGPELWRTNGTSSGTMMVENFNPSTTITGTFAYYRALGTSFVQVAFSSPSSYSLRIYDPANIGGVPSSFTGATCSISPALPTGLSMDSSTCTISGTPSVVTSNTTYTVTANISNVTYQGSVWLSSAYEQLTPSVEGADLMVGDLMDDITFRYKEDYNGNGTAWMVKDIFDDYALGNHSTLGWDNMHIYNFAQMNNVLYFQAADWDDLELWRSDGTESGTYMVKNIRSNYSYTDSFGNTRYLNQSQPHFFVNYGNEVYFRALGDSGGFELWKTDGTESGTVMAANINPGDFGSNPYYLVLVGDVIYMAADTQASGEELHAYDISNSTHWQVKDIYSGSSSSRISKMFAFNNMVYFYANDGTHGRELWKSDGTSSGTVMVKDINNGSGDSYPRHFANLDGSLFFQAIGTGDNKNSIWKSDGTESGTVLFKQNASNLRQFGEHIYFNLDDKLWRSDGSIAGTEMISGTHSVWTFHYFATSDSIYFVEKSPTQPATYSLLKIDKNSLNLQALATGLSSVSQLFAIDDTLYFRADDGVHGDELWRSDGTIAGTVLAVDIASGTSDSDIRLNYWGDGNSGEATAQRIGNTLYFRANDGVHGHELTAYDLGTNTAASNVTGSSCSVSPALPTGLNIDSSTCTISGTPSVVTSNTTYTVTANISGTTYQGYSLAIFSIPSTHA